MTVPRTGLRRLVLGIGAVGAVLATVFVLPASPAVADGNVPGTVLNSTNANLPPEVAAVAGSAKRIKYVSTDINGNTIPVTGLVIRPKTGSVNKTVAWAHGTTGMANKCAPSVSHDVFWGEARAAVASYLAHGFTVAATDYDGIGTDRDHPYLVGNSEARAVIDSVKAARNLHGSLSTEYAVSGHSQGGQAALFVSQLAPTYDGNLSLVGAAAMAPASNLHILGLGIPYSDYTGYVPLAVDGNSQVNPNVTLAGTLTPEALSRASVLDTGCLYEIFGTYADLQGPDLVLNGEIPQLVLDSLALYGNPGQVPLSTPVLITQGTADPAVPDWVTQYELMPQLCDSGPLKVSLLMVEGADHEGSVYQTINEVADWITARFAGAAAPTSCS